MKQKLIENIANWKIDVKPERIGNEKLVTESEKQNINFLGGYKVPVWVLDQENLNGRVYPSALGERIISESPITYALDGHPEDEINIQFEDVKAIGKNPVIENGVMYVEAYFVDEDFYRKAERIIEHGSKLGLSSVGFGELDEDGNIVPETYELIRYFDFVLNPSYGVYVNNNSDEVSESDETTTESSTEDDVESSTEDLISEEELNLITYLNQIKTKSRGQK